MDVTILTPTYNRAYILERLYRSLLNQSNKNFEWLIVDDGSTDDTENLVKEFYEQKRINIRYIYQQNGGKHRALNTGISSITSKITFIVDSDDYLLPNAVESILDAYRKYKDDSTICGFSFLRCYPDMQINGMKFKEDEHISDYISCRLNENIRGDKAEAYITRCLREIPFIEIDGEKFLFEDYVWIQLAEKYKTVHYNIPIYVGDYLEDGLTKNISKTKFNAPIGMMKRGVVMCSPKCKFIIRFKGMIIYITYGLIGKVSTKALFVNSPVRSLFVFCYLPAICFMKKLSKGNR